VKKRKRRKHSEEEVKEKGGPKAAPIKKKTGFLIREGENPL